MTAVDRRRPVEVELKYRVADLRRGRAATSTPTSSGRSPAARSSARRSIEDRYVDTADGALAKAGFAVRLRQTGAGHDRLGQGLARGDGPGGAGRREELEGPADRTAAPRDWPASDARALILELAATRRSSSS